MYGFAFFQFYNPQMFTGDPNAIAKVPGRMDVNYLENLASKENLQILNLM